jgi:1-acyl-sn-glycerol-3-phosphate acyltransferase
VDGHTFGSLGDLRSNKKTKAFETMIRTIFFWLTFLVMIFTGLLVDILFSLFFKRERLYYQVERIASRILLWVGGIKVDISGMENIPHQENPIFVSNHQSGVDMYIYLAYLPKEVRVVIMHQVYNIPFVYNFLKRGGQVMVDMRDPRQAFISTQRVLKLLREGESFFIFPEGTRSPDERLLEFKEGAAMLVLGAQKPIVPMAIINSYKVMQRDDLYGLRVRPGRVRVVIGKPITFTEYSEVTLENARALNAKLKEAIAGLMQKGL